MAPTEPGFRSSCWADMVNLSLISNVFTPDQCTEFGTMFVKSRASGSSVDAELKDFIAPRPIQVTGMDRSG